MTKRVVTLRKSLFTTGAVVFGPFGTSMQTWAALVLLLLFVVIFSLSEPYEHAWLNKLERSALSINVLTLLSGLGLVVWLIRAHEMEFIYSLF